VIRGYYSCTCVAFAGWVGILLCLGAIAGSLVQISRHLKEISESTRLRKEDSTNDE
jgi:hypothetical protein